jgi:purine-binding chemotaxis protein CheW
MSHGEGDDADDRVRSASGASSGSLADRCIAVFVGGGAYAVAIADVQEIIGWRPLTRVFRAPRSVAGVTSLRGEILPVVDVAALMGMDAPDAVVTAQDAWRIVVVREPLRPGSSEAARRRAGLRVDALGPVREMPARGLEPAPATVSARARSVLRGVLPDPPLCGVLDVSLVLDSPELASLGVLRAQAAP